ncbi:MAG: hypothetical protein WCB11_00760, partial [Terriglobales bacterium]
SLRCGGGFSFGVGGGRHAAGPRSAISDPAGSFGTVARPVNSGSLLRRRGSFYASFYATWLPIGGVSLIGLAIGSGRKRQRWLIGAALGLVVGVILLLPSCGSNSNVATSTGGTLAGTYIITIEGSAGTGSSHSCQLNLTVN